MNINNNNANNTINVDLININKINLENKNVIKMKNPIPNLITNNNNSYFDKNDNNFNPPKKVIKKNKMIVINNYLNLVNDNNKNEIINKSINNNSLNELSTKESIINKTREIMAHNDVELNQLSYKLSLEYDHRTYSQYYFSLIKTKHNLIFSFFYTSDYNSRIIKFDLFFINFVIYFALNTLFFDDDTMHKIYKDKGKFDFAYQLPKIIYSTIISSVLNTLLKLLALSEDYILDLKKRKTVKNLEQRNTELNKKLKIIFLLYFIISSILLLFFWFYVSMFCTIYKNTQIHLIKDTLISFGTSLLYLFVIYLLPGLFRIPAL